MTIATILRQLRARGSERNIAGMRRFGIRGAKLLGVSVTVIRALGRTLKKDHALALALWKTGVHEARILASIVDEPAKVSRVQMEAWAKDFDSWDLCDQCCLNLFDKTPFAFTQATRWSTRRQEFIKRAGFALMAGLAWHDREAPDKKFLPFLRAVLRQSGDDRPFVRKAVNWALRQIGKRNRTLNRFALHAADLLRHSSERSARWIGTDAYRELMSPAVRRRLSMDSHRRVAQ